MFNIVAIAYAMKGMWTWLIAINIAIGLAAQLLMMFVQCSDPGIINRDQKESDLVFFKKQQQMLAQTGSFAMSFDDHHLALNDFEHAAVREGQKILSDVNNN